ncbi:hypothetical protein CBR_g27763 [Chara braunii]|uniref:Transmembrane protein n=1 Tax=Chara braunii TaxID=69332 RepID=A0A388L8D6_CHABU|nr:hypothetical protein CBR_g27763 [Chara braunii]|eukprot:GBG78538.1 hypothetical protein CBR_g27763 [Chara braunii]
MQRAHVTVMVDDIPRVQPSPRGQAPHGGLLMSPRMMSASAKLPDEEPQEDYPDDKKATRSRAEQAIHLIPVVIFICALILYMYSAYHELDYSDVMPTNADMKEDDEDLKALVDLGGSDDLEQVGGGVQDKLSDDARGRKTDNQSGRGQNAHTMDAVDVPVDENERRIFMRPKAGGGVIEQDKGMQRDMHAKVAMEQHEQHRKQQHLPLQNQAMTGVVEQGSSGSLGSKTRKMARTT